MLIENKRVARALLMIDGGGLCRRLWTVIDDGICEGVCGLLVV